MADLRNGLLRWWKLDEPSGTNCADSSGNSGAGTTAGTFGAGKINNGLTLVASSGQYITFASLVGLLGDNASLLMWVKCANVTPTPAFATGIGNLGSVVAGASSHYPYTDSNGYLSFFRGVDNTTTSRVTCTLSGGVTRTNWHHLAITTTPGTNGWKFYVNATVNTQATGLTGVYYDADLWAIGRSFDGTTNYYFDGMLDDVCIYNRTVTPDEILLTYRATVAQHTMMDAMSGSMTGGMVG